MNYDDNIEDTIDVEEPVRSADPELEETLYSLKTLCYLLEKWLTGEIKE